MDIKGIFSDGRERAMNRGEGMKASASELLTVFPLIRRLVESCMVGKSDYMDSMSAIFISLCDIIDAILVVKKQCFECLESAVADVKAATEVYMRLVSACTLTGRHGVKPKFHLLWHIWLQLLTDGMVLDTFTCERKHKDTIAIANSTANHSAFEQTITMKAIVEQRRYLLKTPLAGASFVGDSVSSSDLASSLGVEAAMWGRRLRYFGTIFTSDDVIFFTGGTRGFFIIRCCVSSAEMFGVVVDALTAVETESPTCTRFTTTTRRTCINLADARPLRLASAWSYECQTTLLVVHPRLAP